MHLYSGLTLNPALKTTLHLTFVCFVKAEFGLQCRLENNVKGKLRKSWPSKISNFPDSW